MSEGGRLEIHDDQLALDRIRTDIAQVQEGQSAFGTFVERELAAYEYFRAIARGAVLFSRQDPHRKDDPATQHRPYATVDLIYPDITCLPGSGDDKLDGHIIVLSERIARRRGKALVVPSLRLFEPNTEFGDPEAPGWETVKPKFDLSRHALSFLQDRRSDGFADLVRKLLCNEDRAGAGELLEIQRVYMAWLGRAALAVGLRRVFGQLRVPIELDDSLNS